VTHPGPHTIQLPDPSGARAPLGTRIVEVSENVERTKLRDPSTGFVAYVPVGSIARGEALVKKGAMPCTMCHGADLKGMGDLFPSLAGHSPTATARQLFDFRAGARDGKNAAAMKPVVAGLSDADVVDVSAYLASLKP
jgi:cytochrome c553